MYECEECRDSGLTIDGNSCSACCEHQELDHYVCLDCGKELDPGEFIDKAMDRYEDQPHVE